MAEAIRSGVLGAPHGFSTRDGAASISSMPDGPWVRATQVHSADVVTVTEPWPWVGTPPQADALVTDRSGFALAIVTADCAPVLLADEEAGVIGAAHAGWRGAVGGVIANTVDAMEALGADRSRIAAVIGPCIAQASYEVDQRFYDEFSADDRDCFQPGTAGHWQFDLPGFVRRQLQRAQVGVVDDLALDTYEDDTRFYSYRRATHRGEDTGGRQISVIALP